MSLRLRLLLTLAPLFIIGLAAADIGTYAAVQTSLLRNVDLQLVDIQQGVVNVLEHSGDQGPGGPGGGFGQEFAFPAGTYGEIVYSNGAVAAGGLLYGGSVTASSSHPLFPSGIVTKDSGTLTVSGTGTRGSRTACTSRRSRTRRSLARSRWWPSLSTVSTASTTP